MEAVVMHEAAAAAAPLQQQQANGGSAPATVSTNKTLSHLPKREPVEVKFQDLAYTVSLGFRKGQKEIIRVNGRFCPSQLIAIMGPSGAGKSTLLDILSGYRISGVTGDVMVNGRPRNLDRFRRMSCYIQQDDRLHSLLTVQENMWLAAELKLSRAVPKSEHQAIIDEILNTLGLLDHRATRTGRLSGGQKKRLSIALELINNPLLMFLDEPTTGLDSSSTSQCVNLLKLLAMQGRTIVCTIHQPSASLFDQFDHVYILARGKCLYQGATKQLVPYLSAVGVPCPRYHNPADFVIELACGEHGEDRIDTLVAGTDNGKSQRWFENQSEVVAERRKSEARRLSVELLPNMTELAEINTSMQAVSFGKQIAVLLTRGYIKIKRDQTMTHMRLFVNIIVGVLLGILFWQSGDEGSRVLDNWNLLFTILIHHMMTTMMLTVLTFPTEMQILRKEHFNRWYSLKSYYMSINILELPVSIVCCTTFTVIVYLMSAQPLEWVRFAVFLGISILVVLVAQTVGLLVGALFSVVNGTFLAPTLSVPMMMFAGFGVSLRDMPGYLKWGTYVSYLRFGLEGYVGSIYGRNRTTLGCADQPGKEFNYCHYKYPTKFLKEIAMDGEQYVTDLIVLGVILLVLRLAVYPLLRWKLFAMR
ncbi:ATP-binding cassette sub-family G member 4 [Frankliniella fusca]|uniref:ATP-binding cassette sub-family G member 4 n=1 Tax=Frankliniella fusca TaxID=407009 RepID=A0AAE1HW29_9NEOP|nr:ATP-binding cassette sub-family G member 4 [Frankliniella fusca]